MLFLAIESSTDAGSVALWRDGQITERHCAPGQPSSATLLPLTVPTIEYAGGSVRCMIAGVHLTPR